MSYKMFSTLEIAKCRDVANACENLLTRSSVSFAWSPELVTSAKKFTIVPDIVPPDAAQCRYKDALSNYAKAFHLLKSNPPEQRLDARMPYSMYIETLVQF
ncbi:hypothetical protein POJ06DRAFT_27326 [Lipomyces tetrasporus]|uniref:Uncharacterized protein n=1 Tax=Lipomyces tetrasporus TaxID=54092 RepID=A0AAD7VQX7_9ASCO|nr:uncharacterized protein POJ06DRAFT_27326 [Lipomyces tetrasporus]KAJ8098034.1 hypothetical protein POJ06DRAFT_27326 [Lipomyces tetrasporus]